MREDRKREALKLKFLALVLALILAWYSINPAPRPLSRYKSPEADPPDEKRREAEPQLQRADALPVAFEVFETEAALSSASDEDDEDDFEWPEFIDA